MKLKSCKVCAVKFEPRKVMQVVCGLPCAATYGKRVAILSRKQRLKTRRDALLTLGDHHRATQAIFNKYIRLRDAAQPCISCGKTSGQRHAGHYKPVGSSPELRYSEDNIHVQCSQCNNFLSGNLTNYRIALIHKIGQEAVDKLEGPHPAMQYRVEDLKEIQKTYKAKIKEMGAA